VAAPAGARIRDRLRVVGQDAVVLRLLGDQLGRYQRLDLAERVRLGGVSVKDAQRARRKRELTRLSSSRWAGAITRASEDRYQRAMRCLHDERISLRRTMRAVQARLDVPCRERVGRVRGYGNQSERWEKQRRLTILATRLARVEQKIEDGRPNAVIGGKRLASLRHHLDDAGLTEQQWRDW
jgi:hypothetical protein